MTTQLPTTSYQSKSSIEVKNLYTFDKVKEFSPALLLQQHHEFGQKILFSHPLQRRTEHRGDRTQFWYEPSGGLNARLFEGIVVGVRTLTTGHTDPDHCATGGYTLEATFPAYLVAFSPYRNPLYVLPWHTWVNADEYYWHREQATASYARRKLKPSA